MSKLTYESISHIVEEELSKKKYSWRLWNLEWEDVCQLLRIRIYNKLHLYDDSISGIRTWLRAVISSAIKNILRDNYGKYARPCVLGGGGKPCAFNLGDNKCAYTPSGNQCSECPLYKKWEVNKKNHHDIKQTLNIEHHKAEVETIPDFNYDYKNVKSFLDKNIEHHLTCKEYIFYKLYYVNGKKEHEIAAVMKYTTSENRVAGYAFFASAKRKIRIVSEKILKEGGII